MTINQNTGAQVMSTTFHRPFHCCLAVVSVAAALVMPTPLLAAELSKEISTAAEHAGYAADATLLATTQSHLHHTARRSSALADSAAIGWPKLGGDARDRLASLPIWDIAVQTEGKASLNVASYSARVPDASSWRSKGCRARVMGFEKD